MSIDELPTPAEEMGAETPEPADEASNEASNEAFVPESGGRRAWWHGFGACTISELTSRFSKRSAAETSVKLSAPKITSGT